ncbi:MAG: FAD-dependent oxidoreductase [Candidatus Spechtbacteria bacterium]|nr:FAD-dependent oxidoreductase [Candidatus Spechtbacteria bacterium]
MIYDLIIIGGGPAGSAAAIYAARKRIKTLLIAQVFGGQSVVSSDIQNFVGIPSVSGIEMAKRLEEHVKTYADEVLEIKDGYTATKVKKTDGTFSVEVDDGAAYGARAVLVCSGSRRRKLAVKGAEELDNKGISYCASCDAPLFKGQDVVVVGGGNAGFEAAQQLLAYATSVTLLEYSDSFKADPVTVNRVLADPKMKAIVDAQATEVKGDGMVSAIAYKDGKTGDEHELKVGGVFVEIGALPNSELVKEVVAISEHGEVVVDHKTQRTSQEGIWAAGDVSDVLYKQNNISMGDGVKALEDIYLWLQKTK